MKNLCLFLLVAAALSGCKKQTDTVATSQLNEYLPLVQGKFIRYQLDSTRFIDFGQRDTVISYDAKDVVDGELTDNENRPTFRILRYLRPMGSTDENEYVQTLTYYITPAREEIDVVENNLRFHKLRLPVIEGYSWQGNKSLPYSPFYEMYQFSNDEDIDLWEYTYENVNESAQIGQNVYDSTVNVLHVADSSNVPIEYPDGLAYKNYWIERYAKNIGLVYKEVVMWEYQPPNSGSPGFRSGFGLRMTIIDHN